jgi:hypothetical protein
MLPENNINISNGVQFIDYPSDTWYIDRDKKRLTKKINGYAAIVQAVEAIFNIERFHWQIYTPNYGIDYTGLIGQNSAFVAQEFHRRAKDAIQPDSRLLGISDFRYSANGDSMTIDFTVNTVYGDILQSVTI